MSQSVLMSEYYHDIGLCLTGLRSREESAKSLQNGRQTQQYNTVTYWGHEQKR